MNNHTFSWVHADESNRITRLEYSSSAETLPELLADFEQYLRGCGFVFDGQVDIVSEDTTRPE